MWGSAAMVGTDYPAQHSTSGIFQGMEQEMPTTNGFMAGGNGIERSDRQHLRLLHAATRAASRAGDWDPSTAAIEPQPHRRDPESLPGLGRHRLPGTDATRPAPAAAR